MLEALSSFFETISTFFEIVGQGFQLLWTGLSGWFEALHNGLRLATEVLGFYPSFLSAFVLCFISLSIVALVIKLTPFVG